MALKTFNINREAYKEFSKYCKKEGISMSKQIEKFIIGEVEKIGKSVKKEDKKQKIEITKTIELLDKDAAMKKYC